jgi:hypothetical protein
MARAARSPILGFNHNVRYHGRVYHVQTEDSGVSHNRVFTHLFFEGSIIASKRYDYAEDVSEDQVRSLMQNQHKAILKELKLGNYDEKILTFFVSQGKQGFLDVVESAEVAEPLEQPIVQPAHVKLAEPLPEMTFPDFAIPPHQSEPLASPAWVEPAYQEAWPPPVVQGYQAASPSAQVPMASLLPALDLDALPPIEADEGPLPDVIVEPGPSTQGVGVYSMRSQTRERPFEPPVDAPSAPQRFPTPLPPSRAPVVVIRPPMARRPIPRPAYASPPPGGVVVQRTVVIGVGGVGPDGQRPKRPRPAVPYVVKEGSHPIVQNPRAAQVAPAIPAPAMAPATISDKSLDEVILAYLSQDTDPKR